MDGVLAMSYPRAVLTTWSLAFLLALLLAYDMAHAGQVYLEGGIGLTHFAPLNNGTTLEDGTWWQQGFAHSIRRSSPMFKVGLGYAFNDHWSVQGYWIQAGTAKLTSEFVRDEDYDPHRHACRTSCTIKQTLKATDRMQGIALSVTRTFPFETFQPFLKVGVAVLEHQFTINVLDSAWSERWYGKVPMGLLGGGACYRQTLCLETTYYRGSAGMNSGCLNGPCGYPMAKELLVSLFTAKVPLW